MFRVNRQTDYAVRVVLALAKNPQGTRMTTAEIGQKMLIPPSLLQRIVAGLANGGFIKTQPGRDGGLTLAFSPEQITLLQIVEHFEGPLVISDCILKEGDCPFEDRCPVSCQWAYLNNLLRNEMKRITFQQLVDDGIQIEATITPPGSIPLALVSSLPTLPTADRF